MNEAEMKAELERLRAENAKLKSKDSAGLSLKVSEKGAVSLYGMGRFPVTLYKEQWLRILASAPVDRGIHPRKRQQTQDQGVAPRAVWRFCVNPQFILAQLAFSVTDLCNWYPLRNRNSDTSEAAKVNAKHIGHGFGKDLDLCRCSRTLREVLSNIA